MKKITMVPVVGGVMLNNEDNPGHPIAKVYDRARAHEITTAVNAHDQLVAALRDTLTHITQQAPVITNGVMSVTIDEHVLSKMQAALTAAGAA